MIKNPVYGGINDNGGTAFPREPLIGDMPVQYSGMMLRDYFAAKAMQAMMQAEYGHRCTEDTWAKDAYKMADAMLKERCAE